MITEPPGEALMEGRLFKLNSNGDPMNEGQWLKRRMWLSKSGRLWYESMKEVKPIMYFAGLSVKLLDQKELSPGKDTCVAVQGQPIFAMSFQMPAKGKTKVAPSMIACDTAEERSKFMQAFKSEFATIKKEK